MSDNRRVRLFVSSTFPDMMEEGDELIFVGSVPAEKKADFTAENAESAEKQSQLTREAREHRAFAE